MSLNSILISSALPSTFSYVFFSAKCCEMHLRVDEFTTVILQQEQECRLHICQNLQYFNHNAPYTNDCFILDSLLPHFFRIQSYNNIQIFYFFDLESLKTMWLCFLNYLLYKYLTSQIYFKSMQHRSAVIK